MLSGLMGAVPSFFPGFGTPGLLHLFFENSILLVIYQFVKHFHIFLQGHNFNSDLYDDAVFATS